jgi:hypothetical protein
LISSHEIGKPTKIGKKFDKTKIFLFYLASTFHQSSIPIGNILTSQRSGKNHNLGLGTELLITIIGDKARGTKNIELASVQPQ